MRIGPLVSMSRAASVVVVCLLANGPPAVAAPTSPAALLPNAGLVAYLAAAEASTSAADLLRQSIAFHDPDDAWSDGVFRLTIEESRPDGSTSTTRVDVGSGDAFRYQAERDGRAIEGQLSGGECTWMLDGSTRFTAAEAEEFRLDCDRLPRLRNYYAYLWGQPMKLRDPGTHIDAEATSADFMGRPVTQLRVTYEESVGGDIWYFYLDPATRALVGYRFYHDEAANDGEYIQLDGQVSGGGLTLPRDRTWYTNGEDKLLGVDRLLSIERIE